MSCPFHLAQVNLNTTSQLVENEEVIGTLIETNERIIAAMEMYDKACRQSRMSLPHLH
jgi:hypothetical protein